MRGMRLAIARLPPDRRALFQREAHQLLELGPARMRLVERRRERGALEGEQGLGVEDVLAGGAAGVELLAADAEVLLRLADRGARRIERVEALRGRLPRIT